MQFAVFEAPQSKAVCQLFTEVFSDSEGAEEGAQIGKLVSDLIAGTAGDDLLGCVAADSGVVIAAPWPLSQPIGWLAQTLDGTPVPVIRGETRCVSAFNDPALW